MDGGYLAEMAKFDTAKMVGNGGPRGYNQTTSSGAPFWVADPRPQDIRIYDIASQLARICRFGGALRDDVEHYSVAQHCCLVSDHLRPELALEGLLHDAHEAYIGDMIKPIKVQLGVEWNILEGRIEAAVRRRFGLPGYMTPAVKEQDYLAVATEHAQLQPYSPTVDWGTPPKPWPDIITPWPAFRARNEFLRRFYALYNEDCHVRS